MSKLTISYITGNISKFKNAAAFFATTPIALHQQQMSLVEIQADDSTTIALHKVRAAYQQQPGPMFVNDASWHIPALGGFPGPYMKYIAQWLSNDDILCLMAPKTDRTIILRDVVAYKDSRQEKVFVHEVPATILKVPEGEGKIDGPSITKLIRLHSDSHSLAATKRIGFSGDEEQLWQQFSDWLVAQGQA